jgi:hypothetical protein
MSRDEKSRLGKSDCHVLVRPGTSTLRVYRSMARTSCCYWWVDAIPSQASKARGLPRPRRSLKEAKVREAGYQRISWEIPDPAFCPQSSPPRLPKSPSTIDPHYGTDSDRGTFTTAGAVIRASNSYSSPTTKIPKRTGKSYR